MLKWFAKYQKIILVFGGSVLMVLFLLPGTQFLTPDPAAQAIGYIGDEPISGHDQHAAAQELSLLERAQRHLMIHVQTSARRTQLPPMADLLVNTPIPNDALHWLLLLREAQGHGVWASQAEGHSVLVEMDRAGIDLTPLLAEAPEDAYAQAFAHWRAYVQFASMMLGGGAPPSEPRLRHLARDFGSQATIELVALDPAQVIEQEPDPTQEQIVEQFEKYKDKRVGESEPFGYGYIVPPRVKIEYIAVPLERVKASIEVDEVDALSYYEQNKREFIPPPPPPAAPAPATPASEASQDAQPESAAPESEEPEPAAPAPAAEDADAAPESPGCQEAEAAPDAAEASESAAPDPDKPRPYREVREEIIEKLRSEKAAAKQAQIIKFIHSELNRPVNALSADAQGYRKLDGYTPPDLEALAGRAQEEFGVLPDVVRIEETWLTRDDVSKLKGFGEAALDLSGQRLAVPDYIMAVRELDVSESPRLRLLRMQVGVPSRPVSNPQGDSYIFRVLAADSEHPPKDLEEVREQVVRDVKERLRYEALKARADELVAAAREKGLEAVAEEHKATVEKSDPFSLYDPFALAFRGYLAAPQLPVIGVSEPFVKDVLEVARAAEEPVGAVAAAPVDSARKLVIFKIIAFDPMDAAEYDTRRLSLTGVVFAGESAELRSVAPGPLNPESVRERIGYRSADEEHEADEPEAEPQANGKATDEHR